MSAFYEFFLPNTDLGVADSATEALPGQGNCAGQARVTDTIEFTINGAAWRLRKMAHWDDDIVPVYVAFARAAASGAALGGQILVDHCCLQVDRNSIDEKKAVETADDICWLLHLAWGQKVDWTQRGMRDDGNYSMAQVRSVFVSTRPSNKPTISNYHDGALRCFLEAAHPVYVLSPDWWRVTLDWVANASSTPVIEIAGLIYSMLLERTMSFQLSKHTEKQIEDELEERIGIGKPARGSVGEGITNAMLPVAPKWSQGNTDAVLDTILGWNKKPSYKKGIKMVFESVGLPVPTNKVLEHRNSLAHNGSLGSSGMKASPYYSEITRVVTSLLLKVLGYNGKYFIVGLGEQQL